MNRQIQIDLHTKILNPIEARRMNKEKKCYNCLMDNVDETHPCECVQLFQGKISKEKFDKVVKKLL